MGCTPREFRERCNAREHHMFLTYIRVKSAEHEAKQREHEEQKKEMESHKPSDLRDKQQPPSRQSTYNPGPS